jgi:hypothetical protein
MRLTFSRVGWLEEAVDQWIAERARYSAAGDDTDPVVVATSPARSRREGQRGAPS